jgi:hypothetical protein
MAIAARSSTARTISGGQIAMNQIIINSQTEFDKLESVKADEEVICTVELRLGKVLSVYGRLKFERKVDCSFIETRYVDARENSSVVARENSSVVAWGNSSVVARGNSSVVAWGNSSVVAWGNSVARLSALFVGKIQLFGFSVCFRPKELKIKVVRKSKTAIVQTYADLGWFNRNGIKKTAKVILYKRASRDFKTREGTPQETLWAIGSTLTHGDYDPTKEECQAGKFHACSRPYFCDEFRSTVGDRYIAIEVDTKKKLNHHPNLYEWKNPQYPYKIAFGECKVLYECDRMGKVKP